MRRRISQREARRLQKEVIRLNEENEERFSRYRMGYPGGRHILSIALSDESKGRLYGAALVGAVFVAKADGAQVHIYAIPAGAS